VISTTLAEIAQVTGGELRGDGTVRLHGPASIDSRHVEHRGLFAALAGEHVDGHDFAVVAHEAGAAAVLASRPVEAPCVVVPDVTVALGRLATWMLKRIPLTVIAITGSAGKTSVKDLVAQLLEPSGATVAATGSFNNELGVPLTVLRADEQTRFLVVEMGARGIGHVAHLCEIAPPDISVVLNVGSAHLGEFGSRAAIAEAKGEIVEALAPDGVAILNADDPAVAQMALRTSARVLTFGESGNVQFTNVQLDDQGEPTFELTHAGDSVSVHVPQVGAHHAANAAAAAAVAVAVGIDLATIGRRLGEARERSEMRMARKTRSDGVLVIDDTYNANPESMAAAVRAAAHLRDARGGRVAAVLGEMLELGSDAPARHHEIGELAAELGIDLVVAVGEGAAPIAAGAGERAVSASDVDEAARTVSAWLRPDDVVLVKASRGAHLERVTVALLEESPARGGA
jgi:UDP-N-acetylmuramoyl-tripeptide--D-alanyl-D-alanine ligase